MKSLVRYTATFTLLLFGSFVSHAQEAVVYNGRLWKGLSDSDKLMYVVGFVQGAQQSRQTWRDYTTLVVAEEFKNKPLYKGVDNATDFTYFSYGQLKSGLDEFYKDFRNERIHCKVALGYVRDQIKGTGADALDLEISQDRKDAASSGNDD